MQAVNSHGARGLEPAGLEPPARQRPRVADGQQQRVGHAGPHRLRGVEPHVQRRPGPHAERLAVEPRPRHPAGADHQRHPMPRPRRRHGHPQAVEAAWLRALAMGESDALPHLGQLLDVGRAGGRRVVPGPRHLEHVGHAGGKLGRRCGQAQQARCHESNASPHGPASAHRPPRRARPAATVRRDSNRAPDGDQAPLGDALPAGWPRAPTPSGGWALLEGGSQRAPMLTIVNMLPARSPSDSPRSLSWLELRLCEPCCVLATWLRPIRHISLHGNELVMLPFGNMALPA